MPFNTKAKRNAYAKEYRKTHPYNPKKRRMYYVKDKAKEFNKILNMYVTEKI